jgi:hypothetical protein
MIRKAFTISSAVVLICQWSGFVTRVYRDVIRTVVDSYEGMSEKD